MKLRLLCHGGHTPKDVALGETFECEDAGLARDMIGLGEAEPADPPKRRRGKSTDDTASGGEGAPEID